jgi:hypothetical protein
MKCRDSTGRSWSQQDPFTEKAEARSAVHLIRLMLRWLMTVVVSDEEKAP